MAICKRYGYPDLFITITCNVTWPEIIDFVKSRGLTTSETLFVEFLEIRPNDDRFQEE